MAEPRRTVLARISGRVQGVSFRVWTQFEAEKLGLSGWVRNEDDGSVTALISGPESAGCEDDRTAAARPIRRACCGSGAGGDGMTETPAGFRITA